MNFTNRNRNIDIYFSEIRNNQSMTREDEIILFTRVAKGDRSAVTDIFNRMSKLAVAVAKTYTDNPDLLEDLIQEANSGILYAIDKYDPALGYRFSSYARWWMKAYINTFLDKMEIVHPSNTRIVDLVKKVKADFFKKYERDATEYELLDILEDMGEVINDITILLDTTITSIDETYGDDDDIDGSECGVFAQVTQVNNEYETKIENEYINDFIQRRLKLLTEREVILVKLRFGFITGQQMKFDDITEIWNRDKGVKEQLTQERVRQIINGAINKMRK